MTAPPLRARALNVHLMLCTCGGKEHPGYICDTHRQIAAALRAEREACARLAEQRRITEIGGAWDRGYNMAVLDIAQAIRRARLGEP